MELLPLKLCGSLRSKLTLTGPVILNLARKRHYCHFIFRNCHSVFQSKRLLSHAISVSLRLSSTSNKNYTLGTISSNKRHFHEDQVSRYLKGNIINGTLIAEDIQQEVKAAIDKITNGIGQRAPHLSVVLIGNDPASSVYVRNKAKSAQKTGITCDIITLPEYTSEEDVIREVEILNNDSNVDGVLVQLPLPPHMNERMVCDTVLPQKDVDGFHVLNVGRFCVDQAAFIPATPSGVLEIIRRLKIATKGKNAVVCGRSKNVGLPIALHLHSSGENCDAGDATTTICHRYTPRDVLKMQTQNADILVTATGVPGLVTADMIKQGAVVIDIGITRIKNKQGKYRLVGDVDFEGAKSKASLITPVPGGVGPVTVAMVLKNTLIAFRKEIDFNTMNI